MKHEQRVRIWAALQAVSIDSAVVNDAMAIIEEIAGEIRGEAYDLGYSEGHNDGFFDGQRDAECSRPHSD